MVLTQYKANKLMGLGVITKAAVCIANSDNTHEDNKRLLQDIIAAANCLLENEDVMETWEKEVLGRVAVETQE